MSKFSIASAASLLSAALVFCGCPMANGPTAPETVKRVNNTTTDNTKATNAAPNKAKDGQAENKAQAENKTKPENKAVTEKEMASKIKLGAADRFGNPLVPRKAFFGNPEKARPRLNSDGTWIAWQAPVNGVMNVWAAPADKMDEGKPVTKDTHRGIRGFSWAFTNKHLLYSQDKDGDEDFHIYSVNLENGEIKDLTPIAGINAQIDNTSEKFPEHILVGINDRNPQLHDLYKINLHTGEKELIQKNDFFAGFMTDDDFRIRFAVTFGPDASMIYLTPDKESERGWKPYMKVAPGDAMTTQLVGFDKSGDNAYLIDSRDRNTACLKLLDLKTGEQKLLAENDKADISGAISHPTLKTIQAVSFTYEKTEWQILDDAIKPDLDYLKTVDTGELQLTGRTLDDKKWTVAFTSDSGPVKFYLYDREAKKAKFLFVSDSKMADLPLTKMHPVQIKSRDGMTLVSYLSLPKGSDTKTAGRPDEPLPLILNVHGGPWARDDWGYDPEHQLLTNRGYAVLSVNFRGSTGFGKDFTNAANKEWGAKMHDDLLDAVNWAVENKIAVKDKVCIMGGSYGGYATLAGLTFTPDVFTCGVDIVGPSSLITLMENMPEYWRPQESVMRLRVGDWETEEGKEFLNSRSPLNFADKIQRPLLIAQGAKDPRVKQAEADQIVKAMTEKKIPVTYVLFQQEGHGFAKPENRFAFYAVTEAFLAKHLGGRAEDIGDGFEGAVFTIPEGANDVSGLETALKNRKEAPPAEDAAATNVEASEKQD
jgi:dipeptidyl aminopeptidase/acylaminoacyl peptidase